MLRDYQEKAVGEIRAHFARGKKRVLLVAPTGSGKTVIFCYMTKQAISRSKACLIVVRGRKLVDQASQRLVREGVEHGVMMAGHWNYRPTLPVQVCSIDTLIARELRPRADLIVVDEAHMAGSKGYREFLASYPEAFVVPVTATPYDVDLSHMAQVAVRPISMRDLVDQGYLVPFRYFAPSAPDLSGVKVSSSTKDYVVEELAQRMGKRQLVGEIVEHWIRLADRRPTVCFAVNVAHSKLLVERFEQAGIPAAHCDASTPDTERAALIQKLERGDLHVICNVGIMGTGVDIPPLSAIILARPTKSRNLFIQQCGRGTRPTYAKGAELGTVGGRLSGILASEKRDCILLDHAGNLDQHGFPTLELDVDLSGKVKRAERAEAAPKVCKTCFCVYEGSRCPECGAEPPVRTRPPEEAPGELAERVDLGRTPVQEMFALLSSQQRKEGKKKAWIYHQMLNRFALDECRDLLPQWFIAQCDADATDPFHGSPFSPRRIVRP